MFDYIASIDIGSTAVKMIKVKRGFKKFEVISTAIEHMDVDVAENRFFEAAESALQNIFMKEDFSDFQIAISLSSDQLLLRNVTFPFNDLKKISNAIPYEAEENIPYPIDLVTYDFQTIPENNSEIQTVILAAVNRDYLQSIIDIFNKHNYHPVYAGIEANALLRCYEYFNSVNDETILQIDIGYKKTTVNIVKNSTLFYTRSISTGLSALVETISDNLKISLNDAINTLESLDLEITSIDSNIKSDTFKNLGISKPKIKILFNEAADLVNSLVDDIAFTIKASGFFSDYSSFNRIIITGGGSNIKGLTRIIGDKTGLPVVFMPFLNGYSDADIRSRFSICLGNLLVYMNNRTNSVNFLKGDLTPGISSGFFERFRLPLFFVSLGLIFIVINISSTIYYVFKSNSHTNSLLQQKFKKYFHAQNVPSDPIKEAMTILANEKKELIVYKEMLGDQSPFLPMISHIIKNFPGAEGFDIKKINYDGKSMSIEGETRKAADLEKFKSNLLNSGEFENITINIRDTSSSRSLFTITIKQKI